MVGDDPGRPSQGMAARRRDDSRRRDDQRLAGSGGQLQGKVRRGEVVILISAQEVCLMRPEVLDATCRPRERGEQLLGGVGRRAQTRSKYELRIHGTKKMGARSRVDEAHCPAYSGVSMSAESVIRAGSGMVVAEVPD